MKTEYDETTEDYEARAPGRGSSPRPKRLLERWRRIAEASLPCLLSRDGYAYSQHSHDRAAARRLRQLACAPQRP